MKRLLSILIMVCATIVASAESYNIRIAGIEVTDENKDNITAVGADYGIFGGLSYTLRANSSTLQARGDVNALCFERESLVDCHVISPEGAVLDEKKVGYVLGDELCTDVTILPDAVSIESVGDSSNAPRYNLQGIRVDNNYRGIIIQNGKRLLVR